MKVLLVNGSPHAKGCTYQSLMEAAKELEKNGIDTELFQIGTNAIYGCLGCRACKDGRGKCVRDGDVCNELIERAKQADGFIFGSPVYYAGPAGALCAVMDRAFYAGKPAFVGKPAAAIVNCRRGGASAAFDRLNKYFTICRMPVVSSQYWNSTHGNQPEESAQDAEGMQTMRTLGLQMAWLLKAINAAGLAPETEAPLCTNFIR